MATTSRMPTAEATMTTEPLPLDGTQSGVVSEQHLIEDVRRDVCRDFPAVPVDQVAVVVECIWAEYDHALIRDFIPVLVRKQAREELRDQLHPDDTTSRPAPEWAAPLRSSR